jgi:hypothetical protein
LDEVSEAAATDSIAAVYADIRRVLGAAVVAFIYRALATVPGRLERIWAELRPNLTSEFGLRAAGELSAVSLAGVAPIPSTALGVTEFDARRTAATLKAFRRVNGANVLVVHALLTGVEGRPTPAGKVESIETPALEPILPTLDIETLPASVRALLEDVSEVVTGGQRPLLIPSLLRPLAYDPCVLALLWSSLRPVLTSEAFPVEVQRTRRRAAELVLGFPYRVTRIEDEPTRLILRRFVHTIPGMLVAGALVEGALAEALGPAA